MNLQYNINFRPKDSGFQIRISYKDPKTGKWKEKSKQGFKTKKLAKLGADKLLTQLKEELERNKDIVGDENVTVGEMKKVYLEHIQTYRTFNTYKSTRAALSNFDLDDTKLTELSIIDIQKCIDKLAARKLSPTTVKRRVTAFRTMLKFAHSQYGLPIPNLELLVLPEKKDLTSKRRAMDKHEINFLLKHMKMKHYNYYRVCVVAANTGMRLGEVLGLTWDCVDWENAIITVNKQWKELDKGVFGFGELKSKNSYRKIPVTRSFLDTLREIKSINKGSLDNRVIDNFDNYLSLCVNINKCIRRNYDISMHDFRHSFATRLIHEGLDFKTTAKILGHDVEQTIRVYSHVTDEMMEKAKKVIGQFD